MTPLREAGVTRRHFLLGAAATAGLATVGAACGTSKAKVIDVNNPTTVSGVAPLNLAAITELIVAGVDQRIAFVLLDKDQAPIAPTGPVTLAIGPDDTHLTPVAGHIHADALGAPSYLSVRARFQAAGVYVAQVGMGGKKADAALQVTKPADVPSPFAGRKAPSLATPTTTNLLGIDASVLCTHVPVCPLHDLSLDKALAAGRPLALLFATPKFCTSRTCGPTLDVMLGQQAAYQAKVQFMHLEIYPKPVDFSTTPSPQTTFVVDKFNLTSEPILFLIGADGTVQDRIDGLCGTAEMTAALARLAG